MAQPLDIEIERATILVIEAHSIWSANFGTEKDEERWRGSWKDALRLALAKAETRPPMSDGAASQEEVQEAEIEEMEFRRKLAGDNDDFNTRLARLLSCASDPGSVNAAAVATAIASELKAGGSLISQKRFIQRDRLT
ncbi:MAG: hypothetical protein M3Z85_21195, partial [Acidobacteriota bacterium]|nr:hypothetical protein [Acidobacteriota bacterium]